MVSETVSLEFWISGGLIIEIGYLATSVRGRNASFSTFFDCNRFWLNLYRYGFMIEKEDCRGENEVIKEKQRYENEENYVFTHNFHII